MVSGFFFYFIFSATQRYIYYAVIDRQNVW